MKLGEWGRGEGRSGGRKGGGRGVVVVVDEGGEVTHFAPRYGNSK